MTALHDDVAQYECISHCLTFFFYPFKTIYKLFISPEDNSVTTAKSFSSFSKTEHGK